MCNAPKDRSAEIARREEKKRQAAIAEGRQQVDSTLAGFDDNFFAGLSDNYVRHYMPQLDRQFSDAHERIVKQLAAAGLSASSVAKDKLGDLAEMYEAERQAIGSRAFDTAQAARADLERSRADLYSQLSAGLSPADAAAAARAAAGEIRAQPTYSPLGAVFASLLNSGGNVLAAEAAGFRGTGLDLFNRRPAASGSVRVVR